MERRKNRIVMLGTGNATVTHCYNTCFVLQTPHTQMLVDAGGGNGILQQLEKVRIAIADIHHLFVTHAHTDHVLGVIWVIRMVVSSKSYEGQLHVYSHDKVMKVVRTIIEMTLSKKHLAMVEKRVVFHEIHDGDTFPVGDMTLQCFDIHSTKEKQYGFRAELPVADAEGAGQDGGKKMVLVCLGDEPFNEANRPLVLNAQWLMSEAFCLYADRDVYKPYEKCHSTALDAGQLATELGAQNLILYHTEDKTLATRKEKYTAEAATTFKGKVAVPDDLEVIEL